VPEAIQWQINARAAEAYGTAILFDLREEKRRHRGYGEWRIRMVVLSAAE